MSADFEGSVEEIHRAFHETDYWTARLAEVPADVASVELLRIGGESGTDGTIEVVTVQTVHSHNLPGLVTQLHRGDLCIRREEAWGPVNDGFTTLSVRASVERTPVNVWGTGVLSPVGESGGSRLSGQLTVQARIPLIGGKVEKLIGAQLRELVALEQRFTTKWIANNV